MTDIFGETSSELVQLGLVDAVNSDDFAKKLSGLEECWNDLEKCGERVLPGEVITTELYNWFVCEKSDVMRNCMIQNVRVAAQLGDPPEKFYTNASELMNNMLKLKTDRKMQSLTEFVSHVYDLL